MSERSSESTLGEVVGASFLFRSRGRRDLSFKIIGLIEEPQQLNYSFLIDSNEKGIPEHSFPSCLSVFTPPHLPVHTTYTSVLSDLPPTALAAWSPKSTL